MEKWKNEKYLSHNIVVDSKWNNMYEGPRGSSGNIKAKNAILLPFLLVSCPQLKLGFTFLAAATV